MKRKQIITFKTNNMTNKDFLRELKSYFPDIDWTDGAESRVLLLVDRYRSTIKHKTVVKQIYVDREVVLPATSAKDEDYVEIAQEVCENHKITLEQLRANSPKWAYERGEIRTRPLVDARCEFVKKVFARFPHTSQVQAARWLGYRDHSSIYHLLLKRKV
jgi:hypothetical protein